MVKSTTHLPLAQAVFGTHAIEPVPGAAVTAARIDELLNPGEVALIMGPSGAGKSTILRLLARRLRARRHAVLSVDPAGLPDRPVIDCLNAPFHATLNLLASCGLADGPILERRPRELSTGQRWRLALAVAFRRAQRHGGSHVTILIDELGSTLDRTSARCLCRTIRRFVSVRSLRAVCAAHDESMLEALAPSVLAIQPLHAAANVRSRESRAASS